MVPDEFTQASVAAWALRVRLELESDRRVRESWLATQSEEHELALYKAEQAGRAM